MTPSIDRNTFDSHWLSPSTSRATYSKFSHRPVEERISRVRIIRHLTDAVVDHHVAPEAVAGALARMGFAKTRTYLTERLPTEPRTRVGNFGEVLASEHLRQRYGYEMPVFKLRFMDNPRMPMRGEDLVAFRLDSNRTIIALCVGEAKTFQAFDAREVEDAHERLRLAYHPHPVSLLMISNILHDRGDQLAEQVDVIIETLGTHPVNRENWIFIFTGNRPRDPFSVIEGAAQVIENLSCVDLHLADLGQLIQEIFATPLRRPIR